MNLTQLSVVLGLAGTATLAAATIPTVQTVQPAPGTVTALTQITVTFSEPVTNVVATDLAANDGPAAEVTGSGAVYTFTLDRQPDYGAVQITWDPAHGIVDLEQPPNRFDENAPGSTWQYNLVDTAPPIVAELSPPDGVGVRSLTQMEVLFNEPVAGVDAADLLVNGLPATGVVLLGAGKYRFTFPQPASGMVSMSWAGNHGIHDLAPAPNNFAGGAWTYTLDPNLGVPLIRINEFLAANSSGLVDENGETQDWIELWNYGSNIVNLAGYSLSDDAEDPGRWTFPSTNLAPGQYLVVFASAKDRKTITNATNRLHTNFRLSPGGEYLGLFNAESPRAVITEFAPEYPEQRNNYSYGYDSSGNRRYFVTPTPGGSNGTSAIAGILPPPHFNVQRGYFNTPFTLILSPPVLGATIRYTIDGSEPTLTNGSTYQASLTITNTTIFRAAAFKTNILPSLTVTHTYLFLDQVVHQPSNPPGFPNNWGTNIPDVGTASFPPASTTPGLVPADYAMDMDPLRVDPNNINSPIDTVKLQRLKDGLRELPTLSIVMKLDDIFGTAGLYQRSADETGTPGTKPENKKPCSVEMILPDGTTAFATTCGIDLHGNASRNPLKNPKHGFKLNFRTDFGPATLQYRLFEDSPVQEFDDVLLRPDFNSSWRHWSDTAGQGLGAFQRTRATRTRDAWMKDAMRAMGGVASHNRFCHLYLNGLYWGTFEFSEEPTQVYAKNTLGGTEDDFDIYDQGLLKAGTATAYNAMVALPTATTLAQYDQYHQYLNLPAFIDYMLLHFFMGHQDWSTSVTKNWYAMRKRVPGPEGTFRYIPWDGECILLNEDVNRVTVTTPPSGLHTKLDDSPEYRLAFADRVHRHMIAPGAALTPATNIARWQKWQAVMDKPIVAESVRWGDYRRDVHQYSEGTYQLYTRENHWIPENNRMLGYFSNRNGIVLGQLRAANLYPAVSAPSFSKQGGAVARGFNLTMTATNTIYYTLDGSDPRVYGTGAVSSNAATYAGAITVSNSVVVKARALFGSTWSALNEAIFTVDALGAPLRITEIMFNPVGGDAYEFLELRNVSGFVLNVSSWSIDGIDYVFPPNTFLQPGQIIVLGSDVSPGSWTNRYPGVSVFGRFSGRLDNGGEKLSIHNAGGQALWSVDYDDANGWPISADGAGYSLQIIDVFGDPDDPANWRASSAINGTPGTMPTPQPPGNVVLNEVMADNISAVNNGGFYPDWVELHNTTASPVSLANWSLTDDSNPRKFVFPAGTTIAANGYLVVWCDTNALVPGWRAPFGLGRNGDSVFLYDAGTNRIDSIGFGLQLTDLTIGRFGPSEGWTLAQPTPNATNIAVTLAPVSDLVINEWLANAAPGGDDWVELHNRSTNAPVSLAGIHLGTSNAIYQLTALSFVPPGGYVQLFADENPGANHLDFRLPAEGGAIVLYNELGQELDRVTYGPQAQGVTQGRLPDGTSTVMSFPASPSPAASNYLLNYSGPLLNEVLAINRAAVTNASKRTADFVELWNTNGAPFDLSGMRLSTDPGEASQWAFPTGTVIAANGYVVVWFDDEVAASTTAGAFLNTGHSLDGESGEVWLFNAGGQPVDNVVFGFQVADLPMGRTGGGPWALLSSATPGAANPAPVALGSAAGLRFNEWLANPSDGDDWFEIHNSSNQPVELSGLFVSDSPATTALMEFSFPPLSFIAAKGFVRCVADGHPSNGRDHVNFSLAGEGEALRLYSASLGFIDTIYFGLQQAGVSQGRLPDGGANIADFPESPTPAESNYLPIPNAVINEALTHTDAPLEDAIEIYNPTATPVDVSGWYLSDSQDNFQKFRITTGTIAAQGLMVFYQNQLNGGAGSLVPFTLDSSRGDEAWLSAADGMGNLTGYRAGVKFGAAANGISFGRYKTTVAVHFPAQSQHTLETVNSNPKVGPVVMNEIMFHPPDISGTNDNLTDEFVELYNLTTNSVPLFDPAAATNTWRLRGGVSFNFPQGVAMPSRSFLLVVSFDPTNSPATLIAFRNKYGLPSTIPIYGPYHGKLDNSGENIQLFKPDPPQGPGPDEGFVPYVLVDEVNYADTAPWPFGADGGGASLQRRRPFEYGNDPVNWKAEGPTPGRPNVPGSTYVDADRDGMSDGWESTNGLNSAAIIDENQDADSDGQSNYKEFLDGTNPQNGQSRLYAPAITEHPQGQTGLGGGTVTFTTAATGSAPLRYQWRFNGKDLPGQNTTNLILTDVQGEHAGNYDVVVINEGGFAISQSAKLVVNYLPRITVQPQSQIVNTGATVMLSVVASGTGILRYQWRVNGSEIALATNSTLIITNAGLAHNGDYSVVVTDDIGPVSSALATLIVRVAPVITQHPLSQTVVVGSTVTFTVNATGTRPMGYRWRRGGLTFMFIDDVPSVTLTNVQLTNGNTYNVIVTNIANTQGVPSTNAHLVVVAPPTNQVATPGRSVSFLAAAGGPAPLRYQWQFNGLNLPGATNTTLNLTNVQLSHQGTYTFVVTNAYGTPASFPAMLLVQGLTYPQLLAGEQTNAHLSFNATSNQSYSVLWREALHVGRWVKLADVNAQPFVRMETIFDPLPRAEGRLYRIVTPQEVGPINPMPAILTSPKSVVAQVGDEVVFRVFAVGDGPLTYRWAFEGNMIPGVTVSNLVITNVQFTNIGNYAVTVTDSNGSLTSDTVQLSVRPQILQQPQSQTVRAGESASFNVSAEAVGPVTHRWRWNNRFLADQTNATLLLSNLHATNSGRYAVAVSHQLPWGWFGVLSSNAVLTVEEQP